MRERGRALPASLTLRVTFETSRVQDNPAAAIRASEHHVIPKVTTRSLSDTPAKVLTTRKYTQEPKEEFFDPLPQIQAQAWRQAF
jgi:hypothetical protein